MDGSDALKNLGSDEVDAVLILNQGGWQCGAAGEPQFLYELTLQPHSAFTGDFVILISDVVSNSQAKLPQSELNTLYWSVLPVLNQNTTSTKATGPLVISCAVNGSESTPQLLPFAQTPPYTANIEATGAAQGRPVHSGRLTTPTWAG